MSKVLSAIITEEDGGFVSLNPETGVASQGDTVDGALANLKEALELYFEELQTSDEAFSKSSHSAFLTTITI
jgi:predicted RNase H-like HicB family nuclease